MFGNHGKLVYATLGGLAVLVALLVMWSPWKADPTVAGATGKSFFSVDDGATWFADDAAKIAPFMHDGKEAARVYVFRYGNDKPFVNHLERFKPAAKKFLEDLHSPSHLGPPDVAALKDTGLSGREVKRPGDKAWTNCADIRAAGAISTPKSSKDGAEPVPVEP